MEQSTQISEGNQGDLCHFDVEFLLQPVMNDILQPLKIYDLCHVSQVCKSWYQEAKREMDKRYLEYKILDGYFVNDPSMHLSKVLRIKPDVSILFPGSIRDIDDLRSQFELELETSKKYYKKLPKIFIVVGVFESMINKNLVHSLLTAENRIKNSSRTISPGILGLFLPRNKKLNVTASFVSEYDFFESSHEKINNIICDLTSNNNDNLKSTIIIFVANPDRVFDQRDPFLTSMLSAISSKYSNTSYTFWGLVTSYKIFACSSDISKDFDSSKNEAKIVALNLSGPHLESWSTVIKVNIEKPALEVHLKNFKSKIHLKKCNLGLIAAPILTNEADGIMCYNDNDELVQKIKNIFPEITFVGTYCEDEDFYFGINSCDDSKEPVISSGIISIMVISYD